MNRFLRGSCCAVAPVLFAVLVIIFGGAGGVGCQRNDSIQPFDPRALQQSERANSVGAPLRPLRPLPTTLESPYEAGPASEPATSATRRSGVPPATGPVIGSIEPTVRMSLREIIHRAVANSLDVKVAGYQPAIDQTRVIENEGRFDPVFFANFTYSDTTTLAPSNNNIFARTGEPVAFQTYAPAIGIKQDLETGGKIELRYDPSRSKRRPDTQPPLSANPFYISDLTLELTQPLLRNFGTDVNRARITIARNNQRISVLDFRDAMEKNLADIEKAYWQLKQSLGEVRIFEELLDRTLGTANLLIQRGTQDVTRVQISEANARVEQRRVALIRSRSKVRDLSDQIKRLMNDPDLPVSGAALILPADEAVQEQIRFSLEDQIATGLENRLELGQQQLRSNSAAVAAKVAKNNLDPQLNFVGSVGAQGLGSNPNDAISNQADLETVSFSVGLQFEVPLGNREARAIWRRAQLQREQAIVSYQTLVEQVALDVKIALREVEVTWEEMVGTRQGRFAAADALYAVEQREKANEALTPEFVNRKLDLQERLAEAERLEVQSVSNYNIALSALEKAKGTLLRYNNVLMEEAPLLNR